MLRGMAPTSGAQGGASQRRVSASMSARTSSSDALLASDALPAPPRSRACQGGVGTVDSAVVGSHAAAASASEADESITARRLRVFAISDVHSDFSENMAWVDALPLEENTTDVLIVAGDVSDHALTLQGTLKRFRARFSDVFFTPGNHDLWDEKSSIEKLQRVRDMCRECDIHTLPKWFALPNTSRRLFVVPILSWYHASFDTEPDIDHLASVLPRVQNAMTDFRACQWPSGEQRELNALDESLATYFDALNDAWIRDDDSHYDSWTALEDMLNGSDDPLISFSHFLPRIELIPEKRFLFYPHLPKAVGSTFLGDRVVRLTSKRSSAEKRHVHVFGHTHFAWDSTLDDSIRYVQSALCYPSERKQRWGSIAMPRLEHAPVLLFDSDLKDGGGGGGFVGEMPARWSEHYRRTRRDPSNLELAPYVSAMWERRKQRHEQQ